MLFCSLAFFAFFLVVFPTYWALPWPRARVGLLLAVSLFFYSCWSPWLAGVVLTSATLDYLLARGLDGCRSPGRRRALVLVSVTANLGLLCFFKYANFFLGSLASTLRFCGASASLPALSVVAPIGISFYTFEAISYVVDVYRGRLRAERRLSHFLVFILFFPHLVAGPIVRAGEFLPQVARRQRWSWLRARAGVELFLVGLLKKWALGDRMAAFADPVFGDPSAYRQGAVWLALIAYALQIYGDFSGYSDMALGLAHLFGYHLSRNFRLPYLSANVTEFWRRWHISLSSWLRDYLFIPLGGSRGGLWATGRNLLLVMALGGLWHGASWTFVLWGVLHGGLLVVHRAFQAVCRRLPLLGRLLESAAGTALRVGLTFLTVSLLWVLFRCQTLGQAAAFYQGLVIPRPGVIVPLPAVGVTLTALAVALCHALAVRGLWQRLADRLPGPLLGGAYALLLTAALILAPVVDKAFIYFQF
jgi:alginate O-acetyltransferase complex protein AlgI